MKKLVALIFCAFFLLNITPSFAQTGTCQCTLSDTWEWYVRIDNCGSSSTALCVEGTDDLPACQCKPIPIATNRPSNTCACDLVNNVNWSNCQGATIAECIYQANEYIGCQCSSSTTPIPYKPDSYLCDDGVSVDTALGCIPVEMDKFIAWLLPVLFSISGGIAFLLMVYGFILITTSNGDPKAVQGAKETITSAVIGLLISIFAIFILRLIAVDILHIPGIS